jgi:hypothetical protein
VKKQEQHHKLEEDQVASLITKLKVLDINFEPYIEDYVLQNYFKLHDLLPFQLKGMIHAFCHLHIW